MQVLLRAGADTCKADLGGQMPLHLAAKEGHNAVVEVLLASFAAHDDNSSRYREGNKTDCLPFS